MKKPITALFLSFLLSSAPYLYAYESITPLVSAKEYSHFCEVQKQWSREFIHRIPVKSSDKVLDIGSGDGKITLEMAKRLSTGSIIGIDSCPEALEIAKQNSPAKNICYESFDIREGTPKSAYFDKAFSCFCFNWFSEHDAALRNLFLSLKPGGKAYLLFLSSKKNDLREAIDEVVSHAPWTHHFKTSEELYGKYTELYPDVQTIRSVGFHTEKLEFKQLVGSFKNRADFFDSLFVWRKTYQKEQEELSASEYGCFINDVIDAYLKRVPVNTDGSISITENVIEIELVKP